MADRSSPFDGLEELLERLNRQLETATRSWESGLDQRSRLDLSMGGSGTALDLADAGDEYVVTVDVPGYESDDLDSRLHGETLAISGERERTVEKRGPDEEGGSDEESGPDEADETGTGASDGTYIRREREMKSFSRRIDLPDPVDADAVTASVNNGILTVRLPKLESSGETHSIEIE
ncbi:Hsp20/alpha crystallin family protein [Haloterrigena alkaliphila]|uniref:Hsp20/alpha crystallin family protein n=1 Tax=Haloterrigena alkaliphila TaxID=2816475 RepID=A0A8A2VL95_9EURY|nr:Hsp20/alpha crystallin family protein [Haloterrigena alkaliphila]QSW98958.1 Hsp20/alpha crystallin family protein [Haloterrigena alkaliphila]